ncbi:nuclear transport factor 2 family protein [Cellulophaga sp. F20128]|uniref:nuclear transport factor 2 family protein n=1 Tax=Cellulophaga sp. F20128 TaxID=2926413 RepID=UPI001FF5F086|nr:nuclear transport factor 2 family protein [Cellulophaga sp. F20128]MCK0156621.1 nuclear transport factor 2 family protein [Cellulophaga sp. F20128]
MKIYPFLLIVVTCMGVFAQNEAADVQKTIETFFEGFHKQDSILIKSTIANTMVLQTIGTDKENKTVVRTKEFRAFLESIASIPQTSSFEEKIKSYTIKIDGPTTNVWSTYEFWYNGEFSHCGVNSFQLFKEGGVWKIIYLTNTRRKIGCI